MLRDVLIAVAVIACATAAAAQSPTAVKKATEGRDLLTAGNFDEALARFKDAQIELPDAPELSLDIGLALYKLGRFDEAASAFAAAAAAKSVKLEALARFHLGNTLFRQGSLEGALVCLNESLRLNPDDEDAKFNREVVVRHLKERERQKKDEEKKQEIENLLRECLKRETAVTKATRATMFATGDDPPLMESVAELAGELEVSAESRPESRPSREDVDRVARELAAAQDTVAQLAADLLDKIAKEAESRPAAAAGGAAGQPAPQGHDPEKLKRVSGNVSEALAAMKEVSAKLGASELRPALPHEETALRKLLDALNEFLDELTRIIVDQGKVVTTTSAVTHAAGIELALPDSRPSATASRPASRSTPAGTPDPEKIAALAAKEKDLRGRTDTFATGIEGMLQQMKAAETRAADSRKAAEGPKPKDVEEALSLLHKASAHLGTAADALGVPAYQPAFDAEVQALKELVEAKKKLSPPQQQQQQDDQQKKDDEKKEDQQKKEDQKDKEEKKKDEKKLSPEEAQALLDRLKQQEKDWRDKKNTERKPAKDAKVTKDW